MNSNIEKDTFVKADDNKLLNAKCILWIQKIDECLHACVAKNGCTLKINTHKICKINNPDSYKELNKYFE